MTQKSHFNAQMWVQINEAGHTGAQNPRVLALGSFPLNVTFAVVLCWVKLGLGSIFDDIKGSCKHIWAIL